MNLGVIYKITSPSGKIYIGQTKNIKQRKYGYRKINCKSQTKLYNSLLKYGFDNHKFEIIETVEHDLFCYEILNALEIYWIKFYNSQVTGLNIMAGGKNGPLSEETKAKMKAVRQNISAETRKKISESNSGKIRTNDTKQRISDTLKKKYAAGDKLGGMGSKRTKEMKLALRNKHLESVKNGTLSTCKQIEQYDLVGNLIKTWNSIREACRENPEFIRQNIIQVCKGNKKSAKGFIWKYKQ